MALLSLKQHCVLVFCSSSCLGFVLCQFWSFWSSKDTCGICGGLSKNKGRVGSQKPLSLSFSGTPSFQQNEGCKMGLPLKGSLQGHLQGLFVPLLHCCVSSSPCPEAPCISPQSRWELQNMWKVRLLHGTGSKITAFMRIQ